MKIETDLKVEKGFVREKSLSRRNKMGKCFESKKKIQGAERK